MEEPTLCSKLLIALAVATGVSLEQTCLKMTGSPNLPHCEGCTNEADR